MENTSNYKLDFTEFDETSYEDWKKKAEADLKDKSLGSLDWKPFIDNGEFSIGPYYSKEQLKGLDYLREFHRSQNNHRGWKNYVSIHNSHSDFYKSIETVIEVGANGVLIRIDDIDLFVNQYDKIRHLDLEIAINITNPAGLDEVFSSIQPGPKFRYLINETNTIPGEENKWLISNHYRKSYCVSSDKESISQQILDYTENLNKILDGANKADMDLNALCDRIFIYSRIGSEFFLEIAKLRALRLLIKALLSAYSMTTNKDVEIVCNSQSFVNEEYDPHGSIIKSTYAGMSSIIGGCDTLIIEPHEISDLMQGVSAQISNILKEEAHLNKVNDPAAGSYFIDNLTHKLIHQTWHQFMKNQSTN